MRPVRYCSGVVSVLVRVIVVGFVSAGQLVTVGPAGPDYCYRVEKIQPNLELKHEVHVAGRVEDQSGAPIQNSPVVLRRYISQRKQIGVETVSTDVNGRFDLGIVSQGKYRLLASPNRGFAQPTALQCSDANTCELMITLVVNPTDQPAVNCPIR